MKHYEKLLEIGCFTRSQLVELVGSPAAANMIIYDYQKKGLIEKVKKDFYAVISLETKQPVLSRYQLASKMFSDACITHHSAFEVYGYGNQVFYECYVATSRRFTDFEYNGVMFHRVERKPDIEVVQHGKIILTSIEQTVVDSIRDFEKIAGIEEVLRCMMLIPSLNEKKLLDCLKKNNNGFLYQKCGYIFENMKDFSFSETFFSECENHIPNAKRYLLKNYNENVYHNRWKLYAPLNIEKLIDKGDYR